MMIRGHGTWWTDFAWEIAERADGAVCFVVAVCPEAEDAAGSRAARLDAFEVPLVFAGVAVLEEGVSIGKGGGEDIAL